jgi:hypothetical protein
MLTSVAARFVIPAGVVVIVMPPAGGSPRAVTNSAPMEFDRRPAVCGQWLEFTSDDGGSVRVLSRRVRTVATERHRIDTHGWRDDE